MQRRELALEGLPTYLCLLTLAQTTGMRQGELLALHWSDIDFARGAACGQFSSLSSQLTGHPALVPGIRTENSSFQKNDSTARCRPPCSPSASSQAGGGTTAHPYLEDPQPGL